MVETRWQSADIDLRSTPNGFTKRAGDAVAPTGVQKFAGGASETGGARTTGCLVQQDVQELSLTLEAQGQLSRRRYGGGLGPHQTQRQTVVVAHTLADDVCPRFGGALLKSGAQPAIRTDICPQRDGPDSCLATNSPKMHGNNDANLSNHAGRKVS